MGSMLLAAKMANGLTQSQVSKLKRYLMELEAEMVDIGNEQRPLAQELDGLVLAYTRHLADSECIEVDRETAYGYVTRALSLHYEMSFTTKYSPKNVSERLNEAQLVHKYELASFDEPRPKKEKDESQSSTGSSISPTLSHPMNVPKHQISLLKPKEERVGPASETKATNVPFSGITFSNAKAMVNDQTLKKISPETVNAPKRLARMLPKVESLPRPVPKHPEISPQKQIKQEDDFEPVEMPPTVAMNKSRLNLLQALNKAKNSNTTLPPREIEQKLRPRQGMTKTKSDPLPGGQKLTGSSGGASSDSSPNSRASTPLSAKASDDSSAPAYLPIEEYVEPQPTDIAELEQPTFLRFFGLLTLDESKALANRKTERKRRSCNSTERKDFHYGKIDYCEQQSIHIARRRNKRPILYSPPSTRGVKKRKHFDMIASRQGTSANSGSTVTSISATPATSGSSTASRTVDSSSKASMLSDLENNICIVCNKSGSTDSLSACVYCCNIYHLRCHSNSIFNPQLLRQRDNICPVCLQKKQQVTLAQQSLQRDQVLRKRLLRRNAHQKALHDKLQRRKQILEERYHEKQEVRAQLMDQERSTRNQIARLMNCVRSLRHEF
ncbi:uncharacterized protein LOC129739129 isoform X2 [Uranotaenia lowii]|uniref:uncharacterized protein LOC129739129 isoform X2 n=1 Tax=Uranotaenia lowii TaxID=190385 RepID=UPI002479C546|nr:uncharacterized protein LOC129739129 isoform X2 [Uranotaenia lowii]